MRIGTIVFPCDNATVSDHESRYFASQTRRRARTPNIKNAKVRPKVGPEYLENSMKLFGREV